jgi:hypothetical protein
MTPSKILGDLVDSAIAAKTHYEVWWAQASEAKPQLVGVMNAYSDFFHASYDAHYTAFFVSLAHLFDGRHDSSSIPTYFSVIRPNTDPAAMTVLEAKYAALASRARPLVIARHKTVAHVDARLTEKDVFGPLNITWNEVRDVIYDAAEFVAHLASSPSGSVGIPPDRRLIEATLKVIRALRSTDA